MSIKYLLSYIVRGTSSEALQNLLEMTHSNLKIKRRTLQDILANVFFLHQKPHQKTTECGQINILEISTKQVIEMMLR